MHSSTTSSEGTLPYNEELLSQRFWHPGSHVEVDVQAVVDASVSAIPTVPEPVVARQPDLSPQPPRPPGVPQASAVTL